MPSDEMYGGLPYRGARGAVIFDNTSKLVCGSYLSFTNASNMEGCWAKYLRYSTFRGRNAAQAGIRWRQAGGQARLTTKVVELTAEESGDRAAQQPATTLFQPVKRDDLKGDLDPTWLGFLNFGGGMSDEALSPAAACPKEMHCCHSLHREKTRNGRKYATIL
jgi:hypothetical protein